MTPDFFIARLRTAVLLSAPVALAAMLAGAFAPAHPAGAPLTASDAEAAGNKVFIRSSTFRMSGADAKRRATVRCPGGKTVIPLGGGMSTNPPPGGDGEGVYPHSYERLGAHGGWHVTPVLYDPSPGATTPRDVTLQVICGPKSRHIMPVRRTVYVQPGETKAAVAKCPGKRRVTGGGFQRTNFVSRGGNYVTSSHASSPKTWQVTGSAFGGFGGEMTAIAYCRRSGKRLVTEVSATTTIPMGRYAAARTPACPGKRKLVGGGFSSFPSSSLLITDGRVNVDDGSWSAGGYNAFGPAAIITAYGYCHSPKFPKPDKGVNPHRSVKAPPQLQRAEKAAMAERVLHGGCYPTPSVLAKGIHRRTKLRTAVASTQKNVNRPGVVYVIRRGASCDLSRIAFRATRQGRVFLINSVTGVVRAR